MGDAPIPAGIMRGIENAWRFLDLAASAPSMRERGGYLHQAAQAIAWLEGQQADDRTLRTLRAKLTRLEAAA